MVFDTAHKLPYVKIDTFKDTNGVVIVLGDKSHPTGIEVTITYPDWAERSERFIARNELLLDQIHKSLEPRTAEPEMDPKKKPRFYVS